MDDDLAAPFCGTCGTAQKINWAPAFGQWLCAQYRWSRCERELSTPVTVLSLPAPEVR